MRVVKSPREVDVIRKATRLAALGIMEAMRSSRPGVYEYQLDAAARYVYQAGGAHGRGLPVDHGYRYQRLFRPLLPKRRAGSRTAT